MERSTHTREVISLEAVVIRADGTRHDLGVIDRQDPRAMRQLWWQLVGSRLAARRIRAANRYHHEHNQEG